MSRVWVLIHRWSGLTVGAFLVMSGLTGAMLAYYEPIDRWFNPQFYAVNPTGKLLSPLELRQRAEQMLPEARIDSVNLRGEAGKPLILYYTARTNPATGESYALPYDQIFMDPYSGAALGHRDTEHFAFDRTHFMPSVFMLHEELALPEPWGRWLMGSVALVWFFNCLIGFYLTLPPKFTNFLRRWKSSWKVRAWKPLARVSFDLHRAAGLWLWIMLLVIALSAVKFNLGAEVFNPVLRTLMPMAEPVRKTLETNPTSSGPLLSWEEARSQGARHMGARAQRDGFEVFNETALIFDPEVPAYRYTVNSTLDVRTRGGQTSLWLSAIDGRDLGFESPHSAAGNLVSIWLSTLHIAAIGGMPYTILVSITGLVVAMLSITGFIVWLKRRGN